MNFWSAIKALSRRRPKLFEVAVSVSLGIVVQIGFLVFEPQTLRVVRHSSDDAADQMIRLAEQTRGTLGNSPVFTFIDIDDTTYNAWGSHQVTPRDRLAVIVSRLARSRAAAVLLDVDLSYSDVANAGADDILREALDRYPNDAPPLLLVTSLYHGAAAPGLPSPRTTPYDSVIAGKRNIVRGSPLFERDSDGKIRRWRLFAQTCTESRPAILPANHLAAAAIARAQLGRKDPAQAIEQLKLTLSGFGADDCSRETLRYGEIVPGSGNLPPIESKRSDGAQRVLYRVAWESSAVSLGPEVESDQGLIPLVAVRPAQLIADGDGTSPVPGVEGRVAVIAGSFRDSGDWYETPLGRMPGGLLLINAIEALAVNGTPREPSLLLAMSISTFIIVATSLTAAFLRPIIAAPLAAGLVFLIMVLTLPLLRSGVVINLAIPALGVVLYDLSSSIVYKYRQARELGWKFCLKASDPREIPQSEAEVADQVQSVLPDTTSSAIT